ncbi:MAG TPA: AAA family ATPase [Arachidicoccus sp.]|nr:AAA family ATPase [Arachidicoccus sp.]
MLRKYPIGLQSFTEIRKGGYVYIDKTEIIHLLVETGKYYFLSRPRRFGKSLLVDTIEQLFNGSEELFEGLWIHDKWNWTKTHPVIHFDFAELPYKEVGLSEAINRGITRNAERIGVEISGDNIKDSFRELIEKAALKGRVVILVDEYDKPIIDFLDDPDVLETNRSIMKSFYSILKASDKYIRLLLITGVSQFSRVSIFSDLNNLRDITLVSQYGGIAGITQVELEKNFAQEISALQKDRPDILSQIKDWYNGYTWNMQTWVYNPFSLLNFMAEPVFRNYWFATGTPTFLLSQLKKRSQYDVEGIRMGSLALSTFDVDNPNAGALLFQTGYLTIKNISPDGQVFELGYPNREVKASLLDGLLSTYREISSQDSVALVADLRKS